MLLMVKQEIFDALLTGERRRFDVRQTQQTTAAFRNLGLIDAEGSRAKAGRSCARSFPWASEARRFGFGSGITSL